MKTLLQTTGAALLATASLAAQADTFTFSSEFADLSGFSHKGVTVEADEIWTQTGDAWTSRTGDSYARLDSAADSLIYSFTLESASDVAISFWYGRGVGKEGKETVTAAVSWLDSLGAPVNPVSGSSSLALSGLLVNNAELNPAGAQATYIASGLAAGNYSFRIASSSPDLDYYQFHVDKFAVSSVTAVPEPETYAMMLAGLGAIGGLARRRRQS